MDRRTLLRSLGVAGIVGVTTEVGIEVYENAQREIAHLRLVDTEPISALPEKFNALVERVEQLEKARELIR